MSLAYIGAFADEEAMTTIGFFCRVRALFAARCLPRPYRVVADNGARYKAL
ncbi:hypothetical protein GMA12_17900 [Kocuria sediminis]|uniref:Uncharacterized protein n=1 Tax=Kocuria sediminis TaxID=1038857 RepID=A0A6N8GRU8_9MICC|nr:hypothetical protein [Kocuria sediminis]MUN64990.1 hypothetical protein [Kocuria sediminis]